MNLFSDFEFFSTGPRFQKRFDLPDTELTLYNAFIDKQAADHYYQTLLDQTIWREYSMDIYGKTLVAPRMIAWFEDGENRGALPETPKLTKELEGIRMLVESETGIHFNSVLLNLYRDGKDSVAWHSDKEQNYGKNAVIASVSFGETRVFRLRHKIRKDIPVVDIPLQHGSFLLMAGTTQTFWEHQIPKTSKEQLPRINLTFRQINRQI